MKKAVIFDFNGTLYFDYKFHKEAWRICDKELLGKTLTEYDFNEILGRSNQMILKYLFGRMPTDEEVQTLGDRKEEIYRSLCLTEDGGCMLAPGAVELLDKLKSEKIPYAIATSSQIENINFYFDNFGIDRWFTMDNIIYDDGTLTGKPAPDIYLRAAARLDTKPCDCIVFEDAASGVQAAKNAGIGKIYGVLSGNNEESLKTEQPFAIIRDFTVFKDIGELLKD